MFVKKLAVCVFVLRLALVFSKSKVFYFDNGIDTIVDDVTAREDIDFEEEFLHLLDLPQRPKRVKTNITMSAYRYLMDVYRTLAEEDYQNNRAKRSVDANLPSETEITSEEYNQIEESDIIMTFKSTGDQKNVFRHQWGSEIWVNVSDIPKADDVIGAEMKIFKNTTSTKRYSSYKIQLWQILITNLGEILEPISQAKTTEEYTGWISFELTSFVRSWITSNNSVYGIYLTVSLLDKSEKEIKPEDIGIMIADVKQEMKPFIVAFMKARRPQVQLKSRRKRETKKTKSQSNRTNFTSLMQSYDIEEEPHLNECRRHHVYVSFKDLNWTDWIIAPDGYSTYYCYGRCNFPLHSHQIVNNHVIVQSMLNVMNPRRVPKPRCAATKLGSFSVLYFLDDSNVVLKRYNHITVEGCGCQ